METRGSIAPSVSVDPQPSSVSADPQPIPPVRRRTTTRTRSFARVPLWAAATISILTLWIGVGIGIAVTSTPTPWAPPAPVTTPLPATPTGPAITPMQLGDTITLGGATGIEFTVTQAADPAAAAGHSSPSPGYRYLAVMVTITNTTGSIWHGEGVPAVHSVVITSEGKQYGAAPVAAAVAPEFAAQLALPPGDTATGAVMFQVPATAAVTGVQLALTSDAGAVGLWTIS